jgi:Lon protease-like protein
VTRYLPVFPLGNVVVPTQVVPLHVFEPRYRELMSTLVGMGTPAEMGVVLIERGSEVGGGDQRLSTGTVVRLVEAEELPDGRWLAVFAGSHRFRVSGWLPDDPFPQADVEEIPDPEWDPAHDHALAIAEESVREVLRLATNLGEPVMRPGFRLASEPSRAAWELCSVVPLGPLDRQRLLEADDHAVRLAMLVELARDLSQVLAFRLGGR